MFCYVMTQVRTVLCFSTGTLVYCAVTGADVVLFSDDGRCCVRTHVDAVLCYDGGRCCIMLLQSRCGVML